MSKLVEGRVAIVTGGGRGIGRQHALMLASRGAAVVVNDLGSDVRGNGSDLSPAQSVVAEIEATGGRASANGNNVTDFGGAGWLVQQAIDEFGRLDIVINNAGILRDRMVFRMEEAEWDAVVEVHLKGTFATTHHAAKYWRAESKAGRQPDARIINTSSPSGIYGNVGQANYGAAKAGIAAFTVITAMELAKYGVTCNALAPAAKTRMTEGLDLWGEFDEELEGRLHPRWVAQVATWLASPESAGITGRVFDVSGDRVGIAEGWALGPNAQQPPDPEELGDVMRALCDAARPNANFVGVPEDTA